MPPPKSSHFRRNRVRYVLLLALAVVAAITIWAAQVRYINLGATAGFLFSPTGWDISLTFLPYSASDPYWWTFIVGLTNTVMAGAFGIIGATIIGFIVGAVPLANNKILSAIAGIYTDIFRNIPLILQAIFWYGIILHLPPARQSIVLFDSIYLSSRGLALPKLGNMSVAIFALILLGLTIWGATHGWRLVRDETPSRQRTLRLLKACLVAVICFGSLLWLAPQLPAAFEPDWPALRGLNFSGGLYLTPEFAAVVIAIVVYRSAFMAEIFRGGLTSTSRGQIDAAKSLGMRPLATLWTVRLPIALVHIVPPLSNEYINIIKVTAIGIIIGFPDLFWISSNATMQTGKPLPVLCIMIVIYLLLNFTVAGIMNAINERVRARGFT